MTTHDGNSKYQYNIKSLFKIGNHHCMMIMTGHAHRWIIAMLSCHCGSFLNDPLQPFLQAFQYDFDVPFYLLPFKPFVAGF